MVDLDLDDVKLDVHHIFPKKWCLEHNIPPRIFNAIVNKTAISYKANRMIGGKAPVRVFLRCRSRPSKQVQLGDSAMDSTSQDALLIDPTPLRSDSVRGLLCSTQKAALLRLVEGAMGKAPSEATDASGDIEDDESDGDDESGTEA